MLESYFNSFIGDCPAIFHTFSYHKNQKKYALIKKIVTAKAAAIANKTKGFIAIFDIRDLLFFCFAGL